MITIDLRKFAAQLAYFEGRSAKPYPDSKRIWTNAIGHNLEAPQSSAALAIMGIPPQLPTPAPTGAQRVAWQNTRCAVMDGQTALTPLQALVAWLIDHPLIDMQVDALFELDTRGAIAALDRYPWIVSACEVRRRVCADLMFNLGAGAFALFGPSWAYAARGDWDAVAERMFHWQWYQDVKPRRADPLIDMMRTGRDVLPCVLALGVEVGPGGV